MNRDSRHDTTESIPPEPEKRLPAGASARVEADIAGISDTGRVRKTNEDHFLAVRLDRVMETLASNLPPGEIPQRYSEKAFGFLLADGVGGSAAGEVASRTAIHSLVELAMETPDWNMRIDTEVGEEVLRRMEDRFRRVREILIERSKDDARLRGMATTMTVAVSLGPEVLTTHVGDSRAYVLRREGRLERLTRDQTMAQSLADAGAISPEEAAHHPSRHVLTSALATRGVFAQVELGRTRLQDGDWLMLCSDGLTEMVPEETIARTMSEAGGAAGACRRLVDLALEAGGKDNVTVVLARYRIPREVVER